MCSRTISERDDFVEATSDFLEVMADADLNCAMKVCGADLGGCTPKTFKCKFGTNFVEFSDFSTSEIAQKRKECIACDDINIEPVGGQGGIIRTPIRDDVEATDIFMRKHALHKRLKMLYILLLALFLLLLFIVLKRT